MKIKDTERLLLSHADLVRALQAEHEAVDWLMAKLIESDRTFLPSKSPIWDAVKGGSETLSAARQVRIYLERPLP